MISCLILNYNNYKRTMDLVRKIHAYDAIQHILVVDNCSTDGSFGRCTEGLRALKKVAVISTGHNGGYGFGNNHGIKYINDKYHSRYIILANPDVGFENGLIEEYVKCFEADEELAVVSSIPYGMDGSMQKDSAWNISDKWRYLFGSSPILRRMGVTASVDITSCGTRMPVDCVAGSMLMIRTDHMLRYGMYDERMFLFCEETVLGLKFAKAGVKTLLLTDQHYFHEHGISIDTTFGRLQRLRLILKSKIIVMEDYFKVNALESVIVHLFCMYLQMECVVIGLMKRWMDC